MKIEKIKLWLLAGTLGVAVTMINPVSAATATAPMRTTKTSPGSQTTAQQQVRQEIRTDQLTANQQQKELNQQFAEQRKLLGQQLRAATAAEKPAIRQE